MFKIYILKYNVEQLSRQHRIHCSTVAVNTAIVFLTCLATSTLIIWAEWHEIIVKVSKKSKNNNKGILEYCKKVKSDASQIW